MTRGTACPGDARISGHGAADVTAMFRRLREVLAEEPALADEVRRARSPEEASEALARIGALRGVATSAPELRAHVVRLAAATPGALADEQLDGIAGGVGPGGSLFSVPWRDVLEALVPGAAQGG